MRLSHQFATNPATYRLKGKADLGAWVHMRRLVLVQGHAGGVSLGKVIHDHPDKILVSIFYFDPCSSGLRVGETKCNASCPTFPDTTCFDIIVTPSVSKIPLVNQTEDLTLGKSLACPSPCRALLTAKFLGGSPDVDKVPRLCVVPRVCVKTLADLTLVPKQQDVMIKRWPPCEVHELYNNHDAPSAKHVFIASLIVNATSYVA